MWQNIRLVPENQEGVSPAIEELDCDPYVFRPSGFGDKSFLVAFAVSKVQVIGLYTLSLSKRLPVTSLFGTIGECLTCSFTFSICCSTNSWRACNDLFHIWLLFCTSPTSTLLVDGNAILAVLPTTQAVNWNLWQIKCVSAVYGLQGKLSECEGRMLSQHHSSRHHHHLNLHHHHISHHMNVIAVRNIK